MHVLNPSSFGFRDLSVARKLRIGLAGGDHQYGRRLIREVVQSFRPDVVHFHNLYPTLGVGAIAESHAMGCATVQTYHNYRVSCIAGTHYRGDRRICEACWPMRHAAGILRGCYRASRLQSAAMCLAVRRQWTTLVRGGVPDLVICLSQFMRDRLVKAGAPGAALVVKPNSVAGGKPADYGERWGVVYVGRLSPEKGVAELVASWRPDDPPLTLIGAGPLEDTLRAEAGLYSNARLLGALSPHLVRQHIRHSRVLAFPSRWYEGLGLTLLESLAEGTPVVAYDLGPRGEVVAPSRGVLVPVSDSRTFRDAVLQIHSLPARAWREMSEACVAAHVEKYSDRANLGALEACYAMALERRNRRGGER